MRRQKNPGNLANRSGGFTTVKEAPNPRARWRTTFERIRLQMAHLGRVPMVPVADIDRLRELFLDPVCPINPVTGEENYVELDQETFLEKMHVALAQRHFTDDELRRWFQDMDVDLSNSVSWEEFTSYMISAATSFGEENIRAKEFLADNAPAVITGNLHKDTVRRLVVNSRCPFIVTGGFDGLVKLWSPSGLHMHSINNNLCSAAHEAIPAGSTVPVSPIVDVSFNARGTHCFVASADRSVNIYDSRTFALTRKFVGIAGSAIDLGWKPNPLSCEAAPDAVIAAANTWSRSDDKDRASSPRNAASPTQRRPIATGFKTLECAETSALLRFVDSPSSLDIASPYDNEMLFFATHEGSIITYPSLRSSVLPEIPQLGHFKGIHDMPITKIRYQPELQCLITASWDTSFRLTDAATGQCIHRLNGYAQQRSEMIGEWSESVDLGHRKLAMDFSYSNAHNLIATAAADRAVLLWNPMFNLPVASLRGHAAPLASVSFDDVDMLLISMDTLGVCKSWDLRMNRCLQTFGGTKSSAAHPSSKSAAEVDSGGKQMDTPTTMVFSPDQHRVYCAGRCIKSWRVRRSQTHFHPTHIGHCEGVVSMTPFPDSSSLVTADASVMMRWNVRNGKRQALWDLNPLTAEGGDMLRSQASAASAAPGSGGSGSEGGQAHQQLALACFDRDSGQRRVLAASTSGQFLVYNPTNGQALRKLDMSSYFTEEPFRIAHVCNALNTSKAVAVVSPREVVLVSEDVDLVSGVMPYTPCGIIRVPGDHVLFSAVAVYPATGQSTLASIVLGTTDGRVLVYGPTSQELLITVTHPKRVRTRHSSHRPSRRRSTPSNVNGTTSTTEESPLVPTNAAVEDIIFLKAQDLFVTCVGDNRLYIWDLRNGILKMEFCTQLVPEECILCLATGEDASPTISYQTVLSRGKSSKSLLSSSTSLVQQQQPSQQPSLPNTYSAAAAPPQWVSQRRRLVITACDWGFVYVWDVTSLPHASAAMTEFMADAAQLRLRHVFRAHNAPITRIAYFPSEGLICSMSTVDGYVKIHGTRGSYVGHLGQRAPFWYRDARTYGADGTSVAQEDEFVTPLQQSTVFGVPGGVSSSTATKVGSRHSRRKSGAAAANGAGLPPLGASRSPLTGRQLSPPTVAGGSKGLGPLAPIPLSVMDSRPSTRQETPSSAAAPLSMSASGGFFLTSSSSAVAAGGARLVGPQGAVPTESFVVVAPPDALTALSAFDPVTSVVWNEGVAEDDLGFSPRPGDEPRKRASGRQHRSSFALTDEYDMNDGNMGSSGGGGGGGLMHSTFSDASSRSTAADRGAARPSGGTGVSTDGAPTLRPVMAMKRRLSVRTRNAMEDAGQAPPRHLASLRYAPGRHARRGVTDPATEGATNDDEDAVVERVPAATAVNPTLEAPRRQRRTLRSLPPLRSQSVPLLPRGCDDDGGRDAMGDEDEQRVHHARTPPPPASSRDTDGAFSLTALAVDAVHDVVAVPCTLTEGRRLPPILSRASGKYDQAPVVSHAAELLLVGPSPDAPVGAGSLQVVRQSLRQSESSINAQINGLYQRLTQRDAYESSSDRMTRKIREREQFMAQRRMMIPLQPSLLEGNREMQRVMEVMPSTWTSRTASFLKIQNLNLQDIRHMWEAARGGDGAADGRPSFGSASPTLL